MGKSETPQEYRSERLRAVLDLCLVRAEGRPIDESVIYKTFKETAKKFIPDATEEEVSRTIKEYESRKNKS